MIHGFIVIRYKSQLEMRMDIWLLDFISSIVMKLFQWITVIFKINYLIR